MIYSTGSGKQLERVQQKGVFSRLTDRGCVDEIGFQTSWIVGSLSPSTTCGKPLEIKLGAS